MKMAGTSARCRRAMFERGRCHTELGRNADVEFVTDEADDRVMMDCVTDAIAEFARDVRVHGNGMRRAVSDTVYDSAVARKSVRRIALECTQDITGNDACVGGFGLQPQVSFASIVVDFASAKSLDQTLKMFEHVPVVPANRGVKRNTRGLGVRRVSQLEKQSQ